MNSENWAFFFTMESRSTQIDSAWSIFSAGAISGLSVDLALYPLDTIKTRLQATIGSAVMPPLKFSSYFYYSGLSSTMLGSAPSAALFFITYESAKRYAPDSHMLAASIAEVSACTIRVPTELIKQRMQTHQYTSLSNAFKSISARDGPLGFYRGYFITIFRDLPFAAIQFPLYEYLKV
jgi:solute carrier family 25 S-adenosylmethionine transporter 26